MNLRPSALVAAVGCALLVTVASTAAPQDPAVSASALFWAERWDEAVVHYRRATEADASDALAWLRLGISLRRLGQHDAGLVALRRADGLGFSPAAVGFNLAAATAVAGNQDEAATWLEKAAESGFADPAAIAAEPALDGLRGRPQVAKAIQRIEFNARPCERLPEYRQFDFWLGEWEVETPDGVRVGLNRISGVAGGCALLEHWTSARGPSTGNSLNYFDPTERKWIQIWAGSSGGVIALRGGPKDGSMQLDGEILDRAGQKKLFRASWTPLPDGRVRQHMEESPDAGKTWATWFDGYYRKKQ